MAGWGCAVSALAAHSLVCTTAAVQWTQQMVAWFINRHSGRLDHQISDTYNSYTFFRFLQIVLKGYTLVRIILQRTVSSTQPKISHFSFYFGSLWEQYLCKGFKSLHLILMQNCAEDSKLFVAIFAAYGHSNFSLPSCIQQFDLTTFTVELGRNGKIIWKRIIEHWLFATFDFTVRQWTIHELFSACWNQLLNKPKFIHCLSNALKYLNLFMT